MPAYSGHESTATQVCHILLLHHPGSLSLSDLLSPNGLYSVKEHDYPADNSGTLAGKCPVPLEAPEEVTIAVVTPAVYQ